MIRIRPGRPDEHELVLKLWNEWTLPGASDDLEALRVLDGHGESALLLAEDEDGVVGTVVAGFDGWRGNIYRLAVRPADRRKGIGRALVRAAEERLRRGGARRISAMALHGDAGALAFWKTLADDGFQLDPRVVRYVKMM